MRIKISSLLICFLSAIIAVVPFLSGCGQTPPGPTVTPSVKPKSSPTPTFDPNAPPAAFKLSNFRSEKVPDGSANEYWIFIDVENVGGQPGVFSATYRIDNGAETKDSKAINLNPVEKKRVQLIRMQWDISQLGAAYDSKAIEQKQHVIFCGELSLAVTLADRPALALTASSIDKGNGNITITGDVKNISDKKLDHVIVVADIGFENNTVQTYEAPVVFEPVMPNQTTPFRVVIPSTPAMEAKIEGFRVTFKDAAGVLIRAVSGQTTT